MAQLPEFSKAGDLPVGVYRASLSEVIKRFGGGTLRRQAIAERLRRRYVLAEQTSQLRRFVIFGSFVTTVPSPNDVDVLLLMDDAFDVSVLEGEAGLVFDHAAAQAYFGASVFWVRRRAALDGEQAAIEHWQIKRDGGRRGIVEVTADDQE